MAAIVIKIDAVDYGEEAGTMNYAGGAFVEGLSGGPIAWNITVPVDALAATVHAAIKDAAIAAAANYEVTVGALDKKTIIGGLTGL